MKRALRNCRSAALARLECHGDVEACAGDLAPALDDYPRVLSDWGANAALVRVGW
jgi:hypothetical protein